MQPLRSEPIFIKAVCSDGDHAGSTSIQRPAPWHHPRNPVKRMKNLTLNFNRPATGPSAEAGRTRMMENDTMKRLKTILVLGVGLLLVTPTFSAGQIFRKRPEAPAQEEQPFGKEAERARLDRVRRELDEEGRRLLQERDWLEQQRNEVVRAECQNMQEQADLYVRQHRWRCHNGVDFWHCGCGDAGRVAPWLRSAWENLYHQRHWLEMREKDLDRKMEDRSHRDRMHVEKWKRLMEELSDFQRRYRDKKQPLFEEFPKPKPGTSDEKRLEFDDSPKPKRRSLFNP